MINLENPNRNKAETVETKIEHHTASERAFEIAGEGDYQKILSTLKKEGLFEEEINRVRARYENTLKYADWITSSDWEMLTILDCFDEHTAHHCIATLYIAKERINLFKAGDKTFSELIINENVPLEDFYRACLFHDIGKCHIPRSILNNKLSDHEFEDHFCANVLERGEKSALKEIEQLTGNKFVENPNQTDDESLREYLHENHIRTMRYVPAKEILSEEEIRVVNERFPLINIEIATLSKLIEPHEKESEKVLEESGFRTSAIIAGKHHNYDQGDKNFIVGPGVLGVVVALEEFLSLADITQALTSRRSYHKAISETPEILVNLIYEAKQHYISPVVTSLWVQQELELIPDEIKENYSQSIKDSILECESFILEHKEIVAEFIEHINNTYYR